MESTIAATRGVASLGSSSYATAGLALNLPCGESCQLSPGPAKKGQDREVCASTMTPAQCAEAQLQHGVPCLTAHLSPSLSPAPELSVQCTETPAQCYALDSLLT